MKRFILILTVSILYVTSSAQSLEQLIIFGGAEGIFGVDLRIDTSDNRVTVGSFSGMGDFDPGAGNFDLTAIGAVDAFVSKLSADGGFLWAKQIGGAGNAYSEGVAIDSFGNIYISGFFNNTVDFDPGAEGFTMTSNGNFDCFILKLDTDGNFVWAKRFGGSGPDRNQAIEVDALGTVYTTGIFNLTVDFDPGSGSFPLTSLGGSYDVFISKLDTDGNFIWAKQIGGVSNVFSKDIALDVSGNVYSTGYFSNGSPDFDPGAGIFTMELTGAEKMYISKLDASGNFVWAKQAFGNVVNHANSIAISGNDLVVSGFFIGIQDFDPGDGTFELTSSIWDAYVLKLDTDGNFNWVKQLGGSGREESISVIIDGNNSIINVGTFDGTADFDITGSNFLLTSRGSNDAYVHKLDASGNFLWASQIGGSDFDYVGAVAFDSGNDVLSTGYFYETTDFDPSADELNVTSLGEADAFVLKLSGTSLGVSENQTVALQIYPNPNNGNFTIDLGKDYANIAVKITDIHGRVISFYRYASPQTIELKIDAAAGLYFVDVVLNEGLIESFKIIKN
jgi:hypothetical protein